MNQEEFTAALNEMLDAAISARSRVEVAPYGRNDRAQFNREVDAIKAERAAYDKAMPLLTSRRNVQLYIAAIAQGKAHGLISDTKSRLYLAQLALAAFGAASGPDHEPRKAVNNGFVG